MSLRVALVGCGRWGSRLLTALLGHPEIEVAAVIDIDRRALARAAHLAPRARLGHSLEQTRDVDAAIIATPATQHYAPTHTAFELGLDVLVEKPLATRAVEARALAGMSQGRVAMVGHVLRYHPAVERIIDLSRTGAVGTIDHLRFRRFTSSGTRHPLWALAPHDIATLYAIDDSPLENVTARWNDAIEIDIRLASGTSANLCVTTTAAMPLRQTRVIGSDGSLFLDELVAFEDALRRELDHFVDCVRSRKTPRTSFDDSVRIVETLELAEARLEQDTPLVAAQ